MWFWKRRRRAPAADLAPLAAAVDGLMYPSEQDAPFDVIRWPASASPSAKQAVERRLSEHRVAVGTLDDFLAGLDGSPDVARFRASCDALRAITSDAIMIRASAADSASVELFLIGRTPDGGWAGVHTTSIET